MADAELGVLRLVRSPWASGPYNYTVAWTPRSGRNGRRRPFYRYAINGCPPWNNTSLVAESETPSQNLVIHRRLVDVRWLSP